jgi:hypothetical protein
LQINVEDLDYITENLQAIEDLIDEIKLIIEDVR